MYLIDVEFAPPLAGLSYNIVRLVSVAKRSERIAVIEVLETDANGTPVKLELRSNLSMSLDRLMGIFLVLSGFTLLVAVWPMVLGLWPVMLAALIHVVIVGVCFRAAWRGNWARQCISADQDGVLIEHYDARVTRRHRLPIAWLRVQMDAQRMKGPRVYLVERGERHELGRFLPDSERAELGQLLKRLLAARSAWTTEGLWVQQA